MSGRTTFSRIGRRVLLLLLVSAFSACLGRQAPVEPGPRETVEEEARAALLPVSALSEDLLLRQRIEIEWPEGDAEFEAVFQKQGNVLMVLGLGPMNQVGFTLRLEDGRVDFTNRTGRALPFEPALILADVQRVFFPWFEAPAACRPCDRTRSVSGLEVSERWGEAQVAERRFVRSVDGVAEAIVVSFEDWRPAEPAPRRARLTNGWFGYSISIETYAIERL